MPSSLMGSARLRPSGPATSASHCRRWHGCLGSIWLGGTVEARQAQRGSGVVLVSAGGGRRCTFLLSHDLMSDWTWSTLWHIYARWLEQTTPSPCALLGKSNGPENTVIRSRSTAFQTASTAFRRSRRNKRLWNLGPSAPRGAGTALCRSHPSFHPKVRVPGIRRICEGAMQRPGH